MERRKRIQGIIGRRNKAIQLVGCLGVTEEQESGKALRLLAWGTGQELVQTALKQEQILEGSYNDPAECLFGLTCPEF